MSRPYTPGGRFDTDFETEQIHDAITKDLTNPVGTTAQWFVWNGASTNVDPIYDVGSNYLTSTTGTQVTTTMSGVVGTNVITVASNTSIAAGMAVIGSGIADGALVRSVAGTTVTLTLNNIGNISAGTSVNFTSDGRQWKTPVKVPIIRAVLQQGQTNLVQQGFYNADKIHFTIDHDILIDLIPEMLYKLDPLNSENPDPLNRDRIVWKDQVYRPLRSNYSGIISERFTLLVFDCQQIMPEELVNDPQFQAYASPDVRYRYGEGPYGYGIYGG
jgi:hypothetical protein